jgi:type VI secretion system protein ImpH
VEAVALSAIQRLQREPGRFSLDQAAAVIAPGLDPVEIDFRTTTRLGAPAAEVGLDRKAANAIITPTFGLIGPGGVLPRNYTALVDHELRKRSSALHRFMDLLARRFTGLFVKAGAKHKPTRDPRVTQQVLAAAIGLGTPHLSQSLQTPLQALLYHAGNLAARSRSAERLRGMLSEETGTAVRIVEFAGGWVRLPAPEQTRLSAIDHVAQHARLGVDAAVGAQVWDASARFLVELGPLTLADFKSLLPDASRHRRLVELTQLHVGLEEDFAFNPILLPTEVPPLQLGAPGAGQAQLGWTSWLTASKPRSRPASQAVLRPRLS